MYVHWNITQPQWWANLNQSSEVIEPRAYYTEWRKSEREKQTSYSIAYIWNLEKWCWWTYLQGRNRDPDIEDRPVDTAGEGKGRMNWENDVATYTLPHVKQTARGNLLYDGGSSTPCSVMTWKGGMRWGWGGKNIQKGGDIWLPMDDSCCCMAETNTTL